MGDQPFMKVKILPMLVVIIFIFSSLNVIAINSDEENIKILKKIETISFSKATIQSKEDFVSINIEEANTILKDPGKPILPVYVKTYKFPLGTKIIDVVCTPSEVRQEFISAKIEPALRPVPLISLKNSIVVSFNLLTNTNIVLTNSNSVLKPDTSSHNTCSTF
jgi:hypothetical protein